MDVMNGHFSGFIDIPAGPERGTFCIEDPFLYMSHQEWSSNGSPDHMISNWKDTL
jgi:hypothetical protein